MEPTAPGLRSLRGWLDGEPIRHAHVVHLLTSPNTKILVNDAERPRSVLLLAPGTGRISAASERPEDLGPLIDALPPGSYRLTSLDLGLLPTFEGRMELSLRPPVWLYRMRPEDFRPFRGQATRPVGVSEAEMIARRWNPDRDATEYVRRRIQEGVSSGIYVNGELVAWDMTHFETDRVVMLGFLHVKEAYRGQGYAKTVTTATVEKVFAKGKTPAAEVFEDNLPSLRLTEAMGFQKVQRRVWGEGIKT